MLAMDADDGNRTQEPLAYEVQVDQEDKIYETAVNRGQRASASVIAEQRVE